MLFAYVKTKTQISFAVTVKLISAFVFAIRIVQSFYFLNPKSHASSHLLWLYSPACVGPGRKPQRPVFSEQGSNDQYRVYVILSGHQKLYKRHLCLFPASSSEDCSLLEQKMVIYCPIKSKLRSLLSSTMFRQKISERQQYKEVNYIA